MTRIRNAAPRSRWVAIALVVAIGCAGGEGTAADDDDDDFDDDYFDDDDDDDDYI